MKQERRRDLLYSFLGFFFLLFLSGEVLAASGITYQGRLLQPDGTPVTSSSVQFRLQIRTPGAQDCVMYEEIQTVDLSSTAGVFAISLADGTGFRQDTHTWTLFEALSNRKDFSFNPGDCTGANSYSPDPTDNRKFRVFFDVGSGWEALPVQTINYIPMSIETYAVGGFPASSLFRVEDAGALGNIAALTTTQYNNLVSLADGTSSAYEKSGELNGSTIPSVDPGESVRWNGTSWESYSPLASGDEADPTVETFAKTSLPTCSAGEALISDGTTLSCVSVASGTLTESDIPTLTSSGNGVDGGAISGTIGGSTVINTSGNIQTSGDITTTGNLSVTGSATTGSFSTRQFDLYDSDNSNKISFLAPATGDLTSDYTLTLPLSAGTSGQVLSTDGSGTLSWISPSTGSVTGVSGTSPIQVSGTTSVTISVDDATTSAKGVVQLAASTDTTAGLVVQANDTRLTDSRNPSGTAGGDLSGNYPNPTVSKIQGISVSTTDPTSSGHVLRYDGSEYTPSFIDVSDIRSNISGLGGDPTFPTSCTTSQTLTWSALTDAFTCSNISVSASNVSSTAAGGLSATNVQAALEELDSDISGINTDVSDKVTKSGDTMTGALGFQDSYGIVDEGGNPRLTLNGDQTVIEGGPWDYVVLGNTVMGSQTGYGSLMNITTSSAGADGVGMTVKGELGGAGRSSVLIDVDEAQNDRYALRLTAMNQSVEILTATSTGNVGIGTNLPASKLDVQTDGLASSETGIIMRNPSTAAYATTSLDAYTAGAWKSSIWTMRNNTGSGGILGITTADNTGAAKERLRIDSTGNVGIGTDNPQFKLHVVGDVSIEGNLWGGNLPSTYPTYGDASTAGQWVRMAHIEFGEQYQYYSGQFNITAGNPDGSLGIDARAYLRIHQAAAMGSAPNVDLKLDSSTTSFTLSDIVAVATVVTGTQTVVELYGRTQEAWNSLGVQPTNTIYWADATDYSPTAFAATLPTGPQTSAVPGLSFWSLGSTGTSINYSGDIGIGTTSPAVSLDMGSKTDAIRLPAGTTAEQPSASANGMLRYNSDNNKFEAYENGAWVNMIGGTASSATSVSAGAGSVGTPSISFSGDSDTGLYSSGTDTIGISAGGVKVWDITTSGIVSPTAGGASMSSDNGTAAAPTFSFAGDTDTGWYLAAPDTLAASTGAAERMRIDSNGYVGIGTTAPGGPLDVRGGIAASGHGKPIFLVGQGGGAGNTSGGSIWLAPGAAQGTGTPGSIYLASYDFGAIARFKIQDISADTFVDVEGRTGAASLSAIGGGTSLLLNPTAGNVGIGTTAPGANLQVGNSTKNGAILLGGAPYENAGNGLGYTSIGSVQSSGNLVLGKNIIPRYSSDTSESSIIRVAAGAASGFSAQEFKANGEIRFYGAAGATTLNDQVNTDANTKFMISSSGNVGIGTTSPTSPLHVIAPSASQVVAHFGVDPAGTGAGKTAILTLDNLYGAGNFKNTIKFSSAGGTKWAIGNDLDGVGVQNFFIQDVPASETRLFIDPSGNVGIGTTDPWTVLDVAKASGTGTGASQGVRFADGAYAVHIGANAGSGYAWIYGWNAGVGGANLSLQPSAGNVGIGTTSPTALLHVNGAALATAWNTSSDVRLKEHVTEIENPLDKILQLRGVEFDWRSDTDDAPTKHDQVHDIGVIAQEVEKVFPEVVTSPKDGYKSVAYSKLIAPVIGAIKTLYARLVGVENDQAVQGREISSLKAEGIAKDQRIRKLERDNAIMKNWICSKDPQAEICRGM